MMVRVTAAALVALCLAPSARADSKDMVLYNYKDWEVRVVAWDDGTMACVAEVTYPGEAFSIWADKENPIRLQFYSDSWNFGDDSGDVQVQVDNRAPWNMHNANFYKQSVLFDLPSSHDGTQFLQEVVYGDTLYLRDDRGRDVQNYSLSGSQASINALIKCVDALH